ncbi:hypothetical protein PR202_ga30582 [Eleusine coracana subsp. coracana]|uniref:RRM domain-containing protein n=1 Tax=Eleusine coracana subsp. coracana TaxID=191504 RepID=A0AAV5DMY0_ELECO|nr:hypothetical protein PR202_ga30582 [Eleusine coracana subsp. coracana]
MRCGGMGSVGSGDLSSHTTIRVTNLSKETREPDLFDLFCSFGIISRVHIALDEETGLGKGFGFVKFVERQEAERAIRILDGYCYDDLIIRVEWASG